MAAHPQHDDKDKTTVVEPEPEADSLVAKNPFPATMTVPGLDGTAVVLELAVVDGTVYAPRLDEYQLAPAIRQYVTNYCAAWSGSMVTTGQVEQNWPVSPPRAGQVVFPETTLRAILGLKADEDLLRVDVDHLKNEVRVVVRSPRLPAMPFWDGGPPRVGLPLAAFYEAGQ